MSFIGKKRARQRGSISKSFEQSSKISSLAAFLHVLSRSVHEVSIFKLRFIKKCKFKKFKVSLFSVLYEFYVFVGQLSGSIQS